jgi:NADPH-dependent curcumin reductase CurA
VRLEGFIVGDHEARRPDFERAMSWLLRSGAVRGIETASAGIESAFDAFTAMLGGACIGKSVVRLD